MAIPAYEIFRDLPKFFHGFGEELPGSCFGYSEFLGNVRITLVLREVSEEDQVLPLFERSVHMPRIVWHVVHSVNAHKSGMLSIEQPDGESIWRSSVACQIGFRQFLSFGDAGFGEADRLGLPRA